MRQLIVVTLLVFLPLAMVAENQHIKFKQDGEFASLSLAPDPFSNVNFSVSRNFSTTSGTTASLNYTAAIVAPDFSSATFVQVTGEIPASAFTGQDTRRLVLDFDTSQLDPATSVNQSCTIDLITFIETCGPGPLGLIHLEFEENGLQRTQVLDFDEVITSGSTTTHIHQTSDNSTANVQGSIFGVPVSSMSATLSVDPDGCWFEATGRIAPRYDRESRGLGCAAHPGLSIANPSNNMGVLLESGISQGEVV